MKRNLFRRALACLCLCAVLSGGLCVPARAAGFRDVPAGHWAADAISQCVTQGWFQGKSADTFGVAGFSAGRAAAPIIRFFPMCPKGHGTSRPSGPAMSTEP